jgi:hypothetical protein
LVGAKICEFVHVNPQPTILRQLIESLTTNTSKKNVFLTLFSIHYLSLSCLSLFPSVIFSLSFTCNILVQYDVAFALNQSGANVAPGHT